MSLPVVPEGCFLGLRIYTTNKKVENKKKKKKTRKKEGGKRINL